MTLKVTLLLSSAQHLPQFRDIIALSQRAFVLFQDHDVGVLKGYNVGGVEADFFVYDTIVIRIAGPV